ncbi:MAG: hypothetical protein NC335_08715 [Bacteroides sp.]|nr:hypothetical protein [Bacteroides sp.]
MDCSDIISIIDIGVSAIFGYWVATAINKSQTKERFIKDFFTNELMSIKDECHDFFDDICYDRKSSNEIKTGFKLLSVRMKSYEDNLKDVFKNIDTEIHSNLTKIQLEITNSDEFNEQFKATNIKFGAPQKARILEQRSSLLSYFSHTIISINKATINKKKLNK